MPDLKTPASMSMASPVSFTSFAAQVQYRLHSAATSGTPYAATRCIRTRRMR
ncbi:hypothetical protein [Paraburkholderia silvatlantica]|uniref:hypothetical protein n=1 Tax=Paraburkholderia silvatlantica TaxID=321895 RepID=UPI003752DFA8